MTVRIRDLHDAEAYGSVEQVRKTYATAGNARKAANGYLASHHESWDATATVIVTSNAAGRFVPVIIWQGKDATQLCINTARAEFMAFA